jgi:hypothetical protein
MSDVLDLSDLDKFRELVNKMPAIALDAAEVAMDKTMVFLMSLIPPYPPPPAGAPGEAAKHWTDKQRRFFFWALKRGQIKVPYVRTGTLGQHFTTTVTRLADSIEGEWGTNDLKAPWVVGPDYPGEEINGQEMYQAHIHEGRWWQFEALFDANRDAAMNFFETEFFAEFQRRLAAA